MANEFTTLAEREIIDKTIEALEARGFAAQFVENGAAAKEIVKELIPQGAEVLTNTSVTLDDTGISAMLNDEGTYESVRSKLIELSSDPANEREKRRLGSAPDYAIGSVHAVTEEGEILIASASGSQLPGYVYGAKQVVFVVGVQKIVKDLTTARERLRQHVFPLEDQRALKAYGINSKILKEFIFHGEAPGRVHVVLVNEPLGF